MTLSTDQMKQLEKAFKEENWDNVNILLGDYDWADLETKQALTEDDLSILKFAAGSDILEIAKLILDQCASDEAQDKGFEVLLAEHYGFALKLAIDMGYSDVVMGIVSQANTCEARDSIRAVIEGDSAVLLNKAIEAHQDSPEFAKEARAFAKIARKEAVKISDDVGKLQEKFQFYRKEFLKTQELLTDPCNRIRLADEFGAIKKESNAFREGAINVQQEIDQLQENLLKARGGTESSERKAYRATPYRVYARSFLACYADDEAQQKAFERLFQRQDVDHVLALKLAIEMGSLALIKWIISQVNTCEAQCELFEMINTDFILQQAYHHGRRSSDHAKREYEKAHAVFIQDVVQHSQTKEMQEKLFQSVHQYVMLKLDVGEREEDYETRKAVDALREKAYDDAAKYQEKSINLFQYLTRQATTDEAYALIIEVLIKEHSIDVVAVNKLKERASDLREQAYDPKNFKMYHDLLSIAKSFKEEKETAHEKSELEAFLEKKNNLYQAMKKVAAEKSQERIEFFIEAAKEHLDSNVNNYLPLCWAIEYKDLDFLRNILALYHPDDITEGLQNNHYVLLRAAAGSSDLLAVFTMLSYMKPEMREAAIETLRTKFMQGDEVIETSLSDTNLNAVQEQQRSCGNFFKEHYTTVGRLQKLTRGEEKIFKEALSSQTLKHGYLDGTSMLLLGCPTHAIDAGQLESKDHKIFYALAQQGRWNEVHAMLSIYAEGEKKAVLEADNYAILRASAQSPDLVTALILSYHMDPEQRYAAAQALQTIVDKDNRLIEEPLEDRRVSEVQKREYSCGSFVDSKPVQTLLLTHECFNEQDVLAVCQGGQEKFSSDDYKAVEFENHECLFGLIIQQYMNPILKKATKVTRSNVSEGDRVRDCATQAAKMFFAAQVNARRDTAVGRMS